MFGLTGNFRSHPGMLRLMSRDSSQKSATPPAVAYVDSNTTGDRLDLKARNPAKSASINDKTPPAKRKKPPSKRGNAKSAGTALKKPPENRLIQRAEADDPSVSMIPMDASQQKDILPGQEHTSFTHGLGGCSAVLLLSKTPDGTRKSTFGHFSPLGFPQRKKSFEHKIRQHRSLEDHQLVMILPGERQPSGDGATEIVPIPQALDTPLRNSVQSQLKSRLSHKTIPYNLLRPYGTSNAFIVHYPKNPQKSIQYKVCGEETGELN